MSNFDNFDIDQISSKLAQRWHFVSNFHCKKTFVLGSIDIARNAKTQFFWILDKKSKKKTFGFFLRGQGQTRQTDLQTD